MFDEFVIAFVLTLAVSCLIYVFGLWLSPKRVQDENERATYACGEKATFPKLKITVSLYKYLIYFVILDSSVLLVAFASFARAMNTVLFMFYLFILLASSLLLLEGGRQ
jgi:NADH:ubiquinone oxidoreductase subunit 3 (subunit A)